MNGTRVAVLSSSWARAPQREIAVAMRGVAGALSRLAEVDVFVPGEGRPFLDGAFDVTPSGSKQVERVPYTAIVVESGDNEGELAPLAASLASGAPVLSVGAARKAADGMFDGVLDVGLLDVQEDETRDRGEVHHEETGAADGSGDGDTAEPVVHHVGMYARVHPGASGRRHFGLGSIDEYVLVLGDRPGVPATLIPSDRLRWLLARFARRHVVVLEGGVARVWRSRSCVATFGVHTRMDLWILIAQARTVVDLMPGDVYARECVESLRYGVPVVVPSRSAAERLAQAGGGMCFRSTSDLLSCVEALDDPTTRMRLASSGCAVADRWYGDPQAFVSRVAGALALSGSEERGCDP